MGDFGSIIQDSSKIQEETITVEIISNPLGANIEVNNDYIGKTPCTVSLPANYKGEFTRDTIVQALPVIGGQYSQQKSFIGGYDHDYIVNDVIPKRIFFDMNLQPVQPDINVDIDE
ncbi:MAG: PEGA domain-containing protein [Candidatus Scalindua rubra]|uniref:PEGA domain protein n=1 Tax=Candidatus Scalindua brodae TaxID=237368 RepID=A0A0B0EQF4_9BACT|nr:MAG: PEGA domain protein [Candidatus Scalindua brodae]MBZ0110488.1 PEGA domain-containing protein [Candidatus Scalindua rubra]TWU36323.1 PEGA domain protein [Candidatus Brocadiaceae bacterium S225]